MYMRLSRSVCKWFKSCRKIVIDEHEHKRQLVDATVTAFAQALATAVDDKDGVYCASQVDVAVSTPDSSAECWSLTEVYDDNSFTDAVAEVCAPPPPLSQHPACQMRPIVLFCKFCLHCVLKRSYRAQHPTQA